MTNYSRWQKWYTEPENKERHRVAALKSYHKKKNIEKKIKQDLRNLTRTYLEPSESFAELQEL